MDRAETEAKASAQLNRDPVLTEYVRGIACKVTAGYCNDIRVYVMDRPIFNASMAPNGYMEIWSGLLLRVSDEAELAFALGHESGHFSHSHSYKAYVAHKNRSNAVMLLSMGVAVAGAAAAAQAQTPTAADSIGDTVRVINDAIYLASVAAYFAYSREHESEADALGYERAVAAGYRPTAGADTWRRLIDEISSSDFPKKRKHLARSSIFATHPLEAARVEALEKLAAGRSGGESGRERYRAAIRPHLGSWLRDDLRRKDFGETLKVIDNLAAHGEDLGVLNFYRGEAYRLRRKDGDLAMARTAYETATAHADAPAETWRQLGDLLQSSGDKPRALAAYQAYLERAPQAQDRWLVEASLKKLSQGTGT